MKLFSKFITKRYKLIFTLWVVLFAIMTFFAIQLPSKLEGDGFFTNDDHTRITAELTETFNLPEKTIFVLFNDLPTDKIDKTLNQLDQNIEEISEIISPTNVKELNKDGYSYALLHFDHSVDNYNSIVDQIRDELNGQSNITITGGPVILKDINVASQKDLASAEAIGLPIAIIVLLLAFGTIVSALLPIMIGICSVVISLGLLTLLGDTFNFSIYILNIVPMLGLALSIDFALLFINRYREERQIHTIEDSIKITIQTAGRSIIFSALCVMIGLGAMAFIRIEIFQNIALSGAIAVFLAVISGTTLLPSLIILLGDRLNKGRVLRVKLVTTRWQKFASFVMKYPISIIFVSVVLLGIGIIPLKDIKFVIPSSESLPNTYESRETYDTLKDVFEFNETSTVYLLAEREGGWDHEDGLTQLLEIQQTVLDDPLVIEVSSLFTTAQIESVDMWKLAAQNPQTADSLLAVKQHYIHDDKTYLSITLNASGNSTEAQDWVRKWKDKELGVAFGLAGHPKFNQEIFDEISNSIFVSIIVIIISTFFILMIAFKSLLIPLKAILMNIIGLGSAFGILVYLFQYGHLGFDQSYISLIIPVIVFCLVFGLSMDYEVFLISRIQEEYEKEHNNTKATIDGLVTTSKIITSAALIMIVITGAFAFTDVVPVKQIGVGIAIAIAIDATIIRLMLVPSLMKLLGDWNWWLPFRSKNK